MKKPIEDSKEFLDLIRGWKALEDRTIASADEITGKTRNPIIRMIMEMIRHDSEKHKLMQQMIIDSITKEALHLSTDELDMLGASLNRHMEAEAESIRFAEQAMKGCEMFVTKFILSYLLADETKHHDLLKKLDELKVASIATSTGARV